MNIEEAYVSFETAKLLKEKGFDVETEHKMWYVVEQFSTGCHWNSCTYKVGDITRKYIGDYCISMPTLQMAMKWLREVHSAIIIIDTNDRWLGEDNRFYWYKIYYKMGGRIEKKWYFDPSKPTDILRYQTYEEACEAAIKDCLKNLL